MIRWVSVPLLVVLCAGCSPEASVTASPEETRALVEEAFVFAFPMLENYRTMYVQTVDESAPAFTGPFNTLHHTTALLGPEYTAIVRPNNDTVYSMAWFDLRAEPLVLSAPAFQRR